jgi:hypothetical protein
MKTALKAITKGSNTELSPLTYPLDQPVMLLGCNNTWKLGAITKDTGYAIVAAQIQAGKSVLGLYNFRQVEGTEKVLATVDDATSDDTQLFYRANGAGNWTEIADAETAWANFAGIKVEMESFIGYCFFVGHGSTDGFLPVASLTGTTFSTATNVTDMPKAKFIKRFNGQLYVANCQIGATNYPYRVYNSSFPSAGAITWTVATDFKDVDYSESITGMEEAWGKLVVFTEYQTYFYDLSTWKPVWSQGCASHRTIKKKGPYMIWCDYDGVWVSTGGQPQNISGEIRSFYLAGDPRTYFAEIVDEQYFLYLGNVTVKGVSYSNLLAVFDIGKSNWWFRELAQPITSLAKYNESGRLRLYMGTADGQVMYKGKYTDSTLLKSDNGTDISSSAELAPFNLGSLDRYQRLNSLIAFADKPGGVKVYARVIDSNSVITTPYRSIGELTQYINELDERAEEGVILQLKLEETGQNEYWSFLGYVLDVDLTSRIPNA